MKSAPISIRMMETIEAPKTPSPTSARAIAAAPTTDIMTVGWYTSARMAKVPRRNRIPSRLGSLRMDRNADLIPGL